MTTPTRINAPLIDTLLQEHHRRLPRLRRLWDYYRNPLEEEGCGSGDPQAADGSAGMGGTSGVGQARGLPGRLRRPGKERVIENDIAWRLHTMVDFMFGRPVSLQSLAPDPDRAHLLETFLRDLFRRSGGISFFQDLGLLGSIYGFVDVMVRVRGGSLALDLIEPTRTVPLMHPGDYRQLDAYLIHFHQQTHETELNPFLARVREAVSGRAAARRTVIEHTHLWTADHYALYVTRGGHRQLVETGSHRLGRLPVVHIQNLPQPFFYEGLSEVEPLIPLQDELNTRLSDRANRVTFQSFKMYLGKGIEGFNERPVGPGQMWATDNMDASIQEFGGDGASPGERDHVGEIREAMDKMSGVTPLAAGVLRDKIGNLTSENALRITMMGLLAKTIKKRITYGNGIERLCELALHAADVYGLLPNAPGERAVRLDWPDPLPASETQQLDNAKTKLEIGVPARQVLAELGYSDVAD